MTQIQVTKASGERQPFQPEKLERSLRSAGASEDLIREILDNLTGWITDGVTTKQLYTRAFDLLHRTHMLSGMRYRLKQAIMELGPTGFPFEKLTGELFSRKGFSVLTGQILDGMCVTHEVDVIATRERLQYLMECKYTQEQGKPVHVQVPLYVRSRMDDIIRVREKLPEYRDFTFTGWVVTNTRFTPDAVAFGTCSGLNMLAWDYPEGAGLKEMIEKERVYPVTVLSQLTKKEKEAILGKGIVTCPGLKATLSILDELGISTKKRQAVIRELGEIA